MTPTRENVGNAVCLWGCLIQCRSPRKASSRNGPKLRPEGEVNTWGGGGGGRIGRGSEQTEEGDFRPRWEEEEERGRDREGHLWGKALGSSARWGQTTMNLLLEI